MQKINISILMSIALLFSACQSVIETEVNVSDLKSKKNKTIQSNLYVEVPACNNFQDSRKESESLVEAKKTIQYIYEGAKYKQCFTKSMTSFANFEIPIILNNEFKGVYKKRINLRSYNNKALYLAIPPSIKEKIEQTKKGNILLQNATLQLIIKLNNDTKQNFKFTILSVFVNDEPYLMHDLQIDKGKYSILKLSDVSMSHSMKKKFTAILTF